MFRHKVQFEWPGCARKDCEKGWTLVWQPFVSIYFILKEGKEGKKEKRRNNTPREGRKMQIKIAVDSVLAYRVYLRTEQCFCRITILQSKATQRNLKGNHNI